MAGSSDVNVNRGHLTFNAEGNNVPGSLNYSRVIHYPPVGISGVTIGRGYDMGSRSAGQVFSDLTRAGVDQTQARAISRAAGLRGRQAAEFVRLNRNTIGEITERQQATLFNQIYPTYERRAENVYNARTADVQGRTPWSELHPAIKDVLVDVVYQGYQARDTMPTAAANNIDHLIEFIRNGRLSRDEGNRNRAGYLESNRGRGQ